MKSNQSMSQKEKQNEKCDENKKHKKHIIILALRSNELEMLFSIIRDKL